jgi:hypothetical protein
VEADWGGVTCSGGGAVEFAVPLAGCQVSESCKKNNISEDSFQTDCCPYRSLSATAGKHLPTRPVHRSGASANEPWDPKAETFLLWSWLRRYINE